jgi:hypothetical protein
MQSQQSGNLREDGIITAAGRGQVCLPTADKNLQFRKLKAEKANQVCFDCPGTRPTWASVTYGTYVVMILLYGSVRKRVLIDNGGKKWDSYHSLVLFSAETLRNLSYRFNFLSHTLTCFYSRFAPFALALVVLTLMYIL